MAENRKNLIVITVDEMRGDCAGYMGSHDCLTPHLDRLAERGTAMMNHFAVFPKCVPTRVAAMTGRYCHTDGFRTIQQHLPNDHPDVLAELKQRGYETCLFGHNHVWEGIFGHNAPREGYVDYHSYTDGVFRHMLDRTWPPGEPARPGIEPPEVPQGYDFHFKGRIEKPMGDFCDANRAEQAVHYLREVRDRSRPFFMQLNFGWPHPAYKAMEPYYSMYDREAIHAWPHDLPRNAPLPLRKMREIRSGPNPPENLLREIQAVYYGMITQTDSFLGRVLETIELEGLFDNSTVIFFSDHGDFAGQYGLTEKWDTCMADCLLRVPCIIADPDMPRGHRVETLSEHVDVAPTLLELLDIEPSWHMHGESMAPMAEGRLKKEAVFADGGHEKEMWDRFSFAPDQSGKQKTYYECPETMARTKMCRTERWKLVTRLTGDNELYDLDSDPWELDNLWGDRQYDSVLIELQGLMIDWCTRTDTERPFQQNVGA